MLLSRLKDIICCLSLLIGLLFRKILFLLLTTLGLPLLRMFIASGLRKAGDLEGDKVIREVVRMVGGLLILGVVIGVAMVVVRIVIVVF